MGNSGVLAPRVEKEFKVGDLFYIYPGKRVTKTQQIKGDIPYITAVSINNGIDSYIANPIENFENMATVNFFGDCFYHPYKFGIKDGTYALEFKDTVAQNKSCYLYVISCLEKITKNVGSYSKMLTGNIAAELYVTLPTTDMGNPDWSYMESYIASIEKKFLQQVETVNAREQALLAERFKGSKVEPVKWGEKDFKVGDVFDVSLGTNISSTIIKEKGDSPIITGVTTNNGINGYLDKKYEPKFKNKLYNNSLTISCRGEKSGTVFYHPYNFILGNNAISLKLKVAEKAKRNTLLYLSTLINNLPYGGYDNYPTKLSITQDTITLPITESGEIDWQYMEDYIAYIEQRERERVETYVSKKKSEYLKD